jgi:hypothetical protein
MTCFIAACCPATGVSALPPPGWYPGWRQGVPLRGGHSIHLLCPLAADRVEGSAGWPIGGVLRRADQARDERACGRKCVRHRQHSGETPLVPAAMLWRFQNQPTVPLGKRLMGALEEGLAASRRAHARSARALLLVADTESFPSVDPHVDWHASRSPNCARCGTAMRRDTPVSCAGPDARLSGPSP